MELISIGEIMKKEIICFAHRGASGYAPENTLAAFKTAIEQHAPWAELDVYAVENELMVFHDDRLERVTNGEGYIQETPLLALRTLDAGKNEKIPYLHEVLDLANKKMNFNIELKGINTAEPVVRLIHHYIDKGWKKEQFLISSFNHIELSKIHLLDSELKIGALLCGMPIDYCDFATKIGAYSVHPSIEFIDEAYVADAHQRGLKVFVYTVNHLDDMKKMIALNVDGMFTNYPDKLLKLLEEV